MKTLYESILSSSGVGYTEKIKSWVDENMVIFNGSYVIRNNKIYPEDGSVVKLFNNGITELPEYINFADGNYALFLGDYHVRYRDTIDITSFRGLPNSVNNLIIAFSLSAKIPMLDIKVKNRCFLYSVPFIKDKLKIEYIGKKCSDYQIFNMTSKSPYNLIIYDIKYSSLSKLVLKNFDRADISGSAPISICEGIKKIIKSNAPINKKNFLYPIKDAVQQQIDEYFEKENGIEFIGCKFIQYSSSNALCKYNEKWYKLAQTHMIDRTMFEQYRNG